VPITGRADKKSNVDFVLSVEFELAWRLAPARVAKLARNRHGGVAGMLLCSRHR
jgi:hypothetical protein